MYRARLGPSLVFTKDHKYYFTREIRMYRPSPPPAPPNPYKAPLLPRVNCSSHLPPKGYLVYLYGHVHPPPPLPKKQTESGDGEGVQSGGRKNVSPDGLTWSEHRAKLKEKYPEPWNPSKKVSREAMDAIRELYKADPDNLLIVRGAEEPFAAARQGSYK
ncbi:12981_t:CDS:2, partial [Acaulospora colombiana]